MAVVLGGLMARLRAGGVGYGSIPLRVVFSIARSVGLILVVWSRAKEAFRYDRTTKANAGGSPDSQVRADAVLQNLDVPGSAPNLAGDHALGDNGLLAPLCALKLGVSSCIPTATTGWPPLI